MNRLFILREAANLHAMIGFVSANWAKCAERKQFMAIAITSHLAKRSPAQNRRYFALLRDIADQAYVGGRTYSSDSWHEYFKRLFIGVVDLPHGGSVGISTSSLSVEGFAEYMTKVELYALTELNCELAA